MVHRRSTKGSHTNKKTSKTNKAAKLNNDMCVSIKRSRSFSNAKDPLPTPAVFLKPLLDVLKLQTTKQSAKMIMCMTPLAAPCVQSRERQASMSNKQSAMLRPVPGKRGLDICDSSNDSGLGFDHHDFQHRTDQWGWSNGQAEAKRIKLDIKLEHEETNDDFTFPETIQTCKDAMSIIRGPPTEAQPYIKSHGTRNVTASKPLQRYTTLSSISGSSHPVSLLSQLSNKSSQSDIGLRIVTQPEQQHRARYQTEGSRGAVKDRSGNGFPVVQLVGYCKPATLEVFIGTDVGKVTPHMFYQACRVSGKNSTPCVEKKVEGTILIELQLDPIKDMIGTCDCVGILKERNVDVEHRFPEQLGSRSKKKSTRCRMVFRTTITHDNGVQETLQTCSQPIVCTQPPGVPEISKKSLTSCPATGGLELYILGKNFLKDTKVYFQQFDEEGLQWEQHVIPDKEYLQQTHLVCVIPPYARSNITEPVTVRLVVVSSNKTSEPHQFVYTPTSGSVASVNNESSHPTSFLNKTLWSSSSTEDQQMMRPPDTCHIPVTQHHVHSPTLLLKQEIIDENSQHSDSSVYVKRQMRRRSETSQSDTMMTEESSLDMMHDSATSMDSVSQYNTDNSVDMIMRRNFSDSFPRTEVENRAHELRVMDLRMKIPVNNLAYTNTPGTAADLAYTNAPSMATMRSFCITDPTNAPLPTQTAQSVECYLSKIERNPVAVETMSLSQLLSSSQPHQTTDQVISVTTQNLSHLGAINSLSTVCNIDSTQVQTTAEQILLQSQNGLIMESKAATSSQDSSRSPPIMTSSVIQNIPSEMILNTQLSPSLMCQSTTLTQDNILTNMCQTTPQMMIPEVTSQPMTKQLSPVMTTASENAILLKAAVDLLVTQKKISELETLAATTNSLPNMDIMNNILVSSHDSTAQMGSNLQTSSMLANVQLSDSVVKDINSEKKNEDMIPTGFATMTENELISIINPSCFDQV